MGLDEEEIRATYSFTLFFGPGLPLGFNNPSAAAELLLIPVFPAFLTPSTGGGIAVEVSGPLGAGVFEFDSEALSPGEDVAAGNVFDVVDDGAFDSGSSLMIGTGAKRTRLLGESFRMMIRLLRLFFGFAAVPEAGDGLLFEPILI
jgi:hypothetical protein